MSRGVSISRERSYVQKSLLFMVIAAAVMLPDSVQAGELGPELQTQMSTLMPQELVAVWIKLPAVVDSRQLRATVAAQRVTRAGRYSVAWQHLRAEHARAQAGLLKRLGELEQSGLVTDVRPHWLANIIEARVAAGELLRLAARDDLEVVVAVPDFRLIRPEQIGLSPSGPAGVGSNLTLINAPEAWASGYTGKGRLICSFDTGVDGAHPALFNNWKGHDGDSAAAWYDPRDQQSFPHPIPSSLTDPAHGTHAMGVLVGHNDADGDTTGVALDAKWISAAIIDIPGTSIVDAFEWAANPDGDPNSMDDVPDVINHSWGVMDIGCASVFYDLIDNLEALGIVNVFAAGNEGLQANAIRNPANNDRDSLSAFAVGALDANALPPTIWVNSSRGPSECRGGIKPNVTAPGVQIRSTAPGGGYRIWSGTSFAAPHVSGLVALLRQKNPNATVDEIKNAILASASDYGTAGPDNTYGWGVIDCLAALNSLPSDNADPNIRVYAFDHPPIAPGDTVAGTVVLQNIGADVGGISASIIGSHPSLTVLNGDASFGFLAANDTVRSGDSIRVAVSNVVSEGSVLSVDFRISAVGGFTQNAKLYFVVEPRSRRLLATHDANRVSFTISNFGTFGMGSNSFFPAGGLGFTFDGGANDLYEGGLLIAVGIEQVSDGVRNLAGEPDGDFAVLPGGNIEMIAPGPVAAQETFSQFSDARAENPIGVDIIQESYAFDIAPYDDFVILRYVLQNRTGGVLSGLYAGVHLDWDIFNYRANAGGWEPGDEYAWLAYNDGVQLSRFRGIKAVHGLATTALTARAGNLVGFPDSFTEEEKYNALRDGFSSGEVFKGASEDLLQLLAVGPLTLESGAEDTVAFAFLAGNSLDDITATALAAQLAYDRFILGAGPGQLRVTDIQPQPGTLRDLLLDEKPIRFQFSAPVDEASLPGNVSVVTAQGDMFSFQYDPELYVLSLDNGSIYLRSMDTIEVALERGIRDIDGLPLDRRYLETFYAGAAVYPGDANNDGLVDERDILPIGMYWNAEGPARIPAGDLSWEMKLAHIFVPGLRFVPDRAVFADADGSGFVEALDICGITDNWGQTRAVGDANRVDGQQLALALSRLGENLLEELYAAAIDCPQSAGQGQLIGLLEELLSQQPPTVLPESYVLYDNFPNPFNPQTTIGFFLPTDGYVTLTVYNILGQRVAVLLDRYVDEGFRQVTWHGRDQAGNPVASGIYFYRLESGGTALTKRMMFLK